MVTVQDSRVNRDMHIFRLKLEKFHLKTFRVRKITSSVIEYLLDSRRLFLENHIAKKLHIIIVYVCCETCRSGRFCKNENEMTEFQSSHTDHLAHVGFLGEVWKMTIGQYLGHKPAENSDLKSDWLFRNGVTLARISECR